MKALLRWLRQNASEHPSSRVILSLILLSFLAISLWTYRNGLNALPRRDHVSFMMERSYAQSDFDFFRRSLSYSRTRHLFPGDYYLYRPGTTGLLALIDNVFRDNLLATGLISIALHAFTAFSLFLILSLLISNGVALALSLAFLTQHAGMEMVFWRHISPYMLGIFFFALGVFEILKRERNRSKNQPLLPAMIYFTLSTLFHETSVAALLFAGLFIFLLQYRDKEIRSTAIKCCLIPVSCFLFLNLLDIFIYQPAHFFGPSDMTRHIPSFFGMLSSIQFLTGLSASSFLIPQLVRIEFPGVWDRGLWNFTAISRNVFDAFGALFLILIIAGIFALILNAKRKETSGLWFVSCILTSYVLSLLLGMSLGRTFLRTIEYLASATYFFYMTHFFFLLALIAFYKLLASPHSNIVRELKPTAVLITVVICLFQAAYNVHANNTLLSKRRTVDQAAADTAWEIKALLNQRQDVCYGGSLNDRINVLVSTTLLFRVSCDAKNGRALYLDSNEQGVLNLFEVIIDTASRRKISFNIRSHNQFLSSAELDPLYVEANLENSEDNALLFGYLNDGHFARLFIKNGQMHLQLLRNGVSNKPIALQWIASKIDAIKVSLMKAHNQYHLLLNGNIAATLPAGEDLIRGKVGIEKTDGHELSEREKDFFVIEAGSAQTTPSGLKTISVFQLKTADAGKFSKVVLA